MKSSVMERTGHSSARDESPELFAELDKILHPEITSDNERLKKSVALGEGVLQAVDADVRSLPNLAELGAQINEMQDRLDKISGTEVFHTGMDASKWVQSVVFRFQRLDEMMDTNSDGRIAKGTEAATQLEHHLKELGVKWSYNTEEDKKSPNDTMSSSLIEFYGLNGTFTISRRKSTQFASEVITKVSYTNFEQTKKTTVEHSRMYHMNEDDQYETYAIDEYEKKNKADVWTRSNHQENFMPGKNNRTLRHKRYSRKHRKLEAAYVEIMDLAHRELDMKFEDASHI